MKNVIAKRGKGDEGALTVEDDFKTLDGRSQDEASKLGHLILSYILYIKARRVGVITCKADKLMLTNKRS